MERGNVLVDTKLSTNDAITSPSPAKEDQEMPDITRSTP